MQIFPPSEVHAVRLSMPIKMMIVGGPFTGKTTLANRLAQAYHTTVLDPESLLKAAMQAAESYVQPEPTVCSLPPTCRVLLPRPA